MTQFQYFMAVIAGVLVNGAMSLHPMLWGGAVVASLLCLAYRKPNPEH